MRESGGNRVGVILAVCVCLLVSCGSEPIDAPPEGAADPATGAAAEPPSPAAAVSREVVRLVAGAPVPPGFPRSLPVPEGATLVSAYDGGEDHNVVMYESTDSIEVLVEELRKSYGESGWSVSFADSHGGQGIVMTSKDDLAVLTTLRGAASGGTEIKIAAEKMTATR